MAGSDQLGCETGKAGERRNSVSTLWGPTDTVSLGFVDDEPRCSPG